MIRPAAALSTLLLTSGAAVASDQGAAPLVFRKATARAEVDLRIPKALSAWPALRAMLVKSDTAKLTGFVRAAEGGPRSPGQPKRRNWRTIRYRVAGTTPRLVSVIRFDDRDTGGAHPLPTVSGVIWDQRTKRRLPLTALIRPDIDMAPLDAALCEAVKAAKKGRQGAAPIDGRIWRCPVFSQAQAALAPSTLAGKAGGLIVLINPYEVGPYAEGSYKVIVPLAAIRRALRGSIAPEFAGAPSQEARDLTDPDAEIKPRRRAAPGSRG